MTASAARRAVESWLAQYGIRSDGELLELLDALEAGAGIEATDGIRYLEAGEPITVELVDLGPMVTPEAVERYRAERDPDRISCAICDGYPVGTFPLCGEHAAAIR